MSDDERMKMPEKAFQYSPQVQQQKKDSEDSWSERKEQPIVSSAANDM
jgi:hypothetical protein